MNQINENNPSLDGTQKLPDEKMEENTDNRLEENIDNTFCATIAIVGQPNAGKSSLFNHIMQQTLSIATHKVQTTRVSVRGVLNLDQVQLVFVDTPGMFQPAANKKLEKYIVNNAYSSIKKVNIAVLLLDGYDIAKALIEARDKAENSGSNLLEQKNQSSENDLANNQENNTTNSKEEVNYSIIVKVLNSNQNIIDFIDKNRTIIKQIKQNNPKTQILLVLNKIDLLQVDSSFMQNINNITKYLQQKLSIGSKRQEIFENNEIKEDAIQSCAITQQPSQKSPICLGISTLGSLGIKPLIAILTTMACEYTSPWLFVDGKHTDVTERTLAEEMTREQLYMQLGQELPYASKVMTDRWLDNPDGSSTIHQSIHVLKESQKTIVVGCKGEMIRSIGQQARLKISELLDRKIHLFLHVKIKSDWIDRLR